MNTDTACEICVNLCSSVVRYSSKDQKKLKGLSVQTPDSAKIQKHPPDKADLRHPWQKYNACVVRFIYSRILLRPDATSLPP